MSALQFNGMLEALDRARERKRIRGASTLPDSTSTPYVAEGESRRSRKRPRHKKTAATSLRPSADHSPPSWDVDDDDVAWVKRLTFNGRARELCRRFGALTGKTRIGITPRLHDKLLSIFSRGGGVLCWAEGGGVICESSGRFLLYDCLP